MRGTTSKRVKAGALAMGVVGMLGLVAASSGPAGAQGGADAVITMEFDGMSAPKFEGDKVIESGDTLQIVNNSNPEQIGPHTFTLIEKDLIPGSKQERKDCFKGKSKVCKRIFKAHEVDFQNETVGKPLVEEGKLGWDKEFTEKKDGDSWFVQEQNDSITQTLSAKKGTKLAYFCVIHPEMVGKIKVIDPN